VAVQWRRGRWEERRRDTEAKKGREGRHKSGVKEAACGKANRVVDWLLDWHVCCSQVCRKEYRSSKIIPKGDQSEGQGIEGKEEENMAINHKGWFGG